MFAKGSWGDDQTRDDDDEQRVSDSEEGGCGG
jgi:hypothetical protein